MTNKPIERDTLVRCSKCSLGTFSDGTRIGGLISMISPGKGQCVHCGAKYTIKIKEYNPNAYIEQEIGDVTF